MADSSRMRIVEFTAEHRPWATEVLKEYWGSTQVVTRGRIHDAADLPGFIALLDEDPAGLLTYHISDLECEIVSLNSLTAGRGIGRGLLEEVNKKAAALGCQRILLITTNDNLAAMRFYQKRGFRFAAIHVNALEETRRLKPELSLIGLDEIPLRDEIELEMSLIDDAKLVP